MILLLGNDAAIEAQPGTTADSPDGFSSDAAAPISIEGPQVTTIEVPDERPLDAALTEIKTIWGLHSTADAPTWVDGNNELLVLAVASTFKCPVGDPNKENESDES